MQARVLVVDDDVVVCRLLRQALQQEGFQVEVAHDGAGALRALASPTAPPIILLDWGLPDMDGLEVCRRLRAAPETAEVYVFLISGRQSAEDVLQVFSAGVDEFIAKPFAPTTVAARLLAAERRRQAGGVRGASGVRALLRELGQSRVTGEVIVRSARRVGRIVCHEGRIAWIHLSEGAPLLPFLSRLGVGEDEARLALKECRDKGLPFMDTLVSWGLAEPHVLREELREELGQRLGHLLQLPSVEGFFVPESSSFRSGFLYRLDELDPASATRAPPEERGARRAVSLLPPPVLSGEMLALTERFEQLEGLVSLVVFEPRSGQFLLKSGQLCDENIVRKMSRPFFLDVGDPFEESFLVSQGGYHIMRRLPNLHHLYVHVDRKKNPNLGMIRVFLGQHAVEPG